MRDKQYLRIHHMLNANFANHNDREIEKALNLINSQLHELINGKKKKQPKLNELVEELKVERENMPPINEKLLSLYDEYINELELILYSTIT